MSTRKDSKGFLLGALAGGIIGSVTALLFAPKPGKELRQDISAGAQKVGDTTVRAANVVGETTGRIAKEIGGQASNFACNVVNGVRSIRRKAETTAIVSISGTESPPEKLADSVDEAIQSATDTESETSVKEL